MLIHSCVNSRWEYLEVVQNGEEIIASGYFPDYTSDTILLGYIYSSEIPPCTGVCASRFYMRKSPDAILIPFDPGFTRDTETGELATGPVTGLPHHPATGETRGTFRTVAWMASGFKPGAYKHRYTSYFPGDREHVIVLARFFHYTSNSLHNGILLPRPDEISEPLRITDSVLTIIPEQVLMKPECHMETSGLKVTGFSAGFQSGLRLSSVTPLIIQAPYLIAGTNVTRLPDCLVIHGETWITGGPGAWPLSLYVGGKMLWSLDCSRLDPRGRFILQPEAEDSRSCYSYYGE